MNDEWIEHDGGACPVDELAEVNAKFANGKVFDLSAFPACLLNWAHITHYRIVKESST